MAPSRTARGFVSVCQTLMAALVPVVGLGDTASRVSLSLLRSVTGILKKKTM